MNAKFARYLAVSVFILAFGVSPHVGAQQQTERGTTGQDQSPIPRRERAEGARQTRDAAASGTETILGVVSAVTAEGEMMLDHRSNVVAKTETAFLTVVASPVKPEGRRAERRAKAVAREAHARPEKKRHNVYIVGITPRTKVFEPDTESGKTSKDQDHEQAQTHGKEVTLDELEVGDHVEIQFSHADQSGASHSVHQTHQMRRKHGRHRTFVGDATAITIVSPKEHEQADASGDKKTDE
jgi:hypothetical protein